MRCRTPGSPRARRPTARWRCRSCWMCRSSSSTSRRADAIDVIRGAQTKGLKIYGETCPQYLFLTADDIGMDLEGTKFCCSPPPRDAANQEAVWRGLQRHVPGVLVRPRALSLRRDRQAVEGRQDHFQGHRQRRAGHRAARAAVVFRRGADRPARSQPLCRADRDQPRAALRALSEKGTIAVGTDADIASGTGPQVHVSAGMLHDNTGYTPYEGRHVTGWPVTVISRGRVVVEDGALKAERGSGNFLPCALSEMAKPPAAPRRNWPSPRRAAERWFEAGTGLNPRQADRWSRSRSSICRRSSKAASRPGAAQLARPGAACRGARLSPLSGWPSTTTARHRQRRDRGGAGACRRRHRGIHDRRRRDHAAQPRAADGRRAVRHAGGAASRPGRAGARPRAGLGPADARAMRRNLLAGDDQFPHDVVELMRISRRRARPAAAGGARRRARRADLDTGVEPVRRAARGDLGLPFAFASHFAPAAMMQAIAIYRERFGPSAQLADAAGDARRHLRRGRERRGGAVPLLVAAAIDAQQPHRHAEPHAAAGRRFRGLARPLSARGRRRRARRGDRRQRAKPCGAGSRSSSARTGADELMVTANIYDHDKRKRSFEIIAEVGGVKPANLAPAPPSSGTAAPIRPRPARKSRSPQSRNCSYCR